MRIWQGAEHPAKHVIYLIGSIMALPEAHPRAHIYAALMREIKSRMIAIAATYAEMAADPEHPQAFIKGEFCFLQLRFVCELIALAAVAAHEPLGLTKDLLKSYQPERMFSLLSDINPQCFPMPVRRLNTGERTHHLEPKLGEMTAADLKAVYDATGDVLHAGLAKHILNNRRRLLDMEKLHGWANAIASFLIEHIVAIPSEGLILFVHVSVEQDVTVVTVRSEDGGPFRLGPDWDPLAYGRPTNRLGE
jgi:hypothetical protein